MPVVAMFYGIIVSMYFMDSRRHKRPHIHVRCQAHEATVAIPGGQLIEGRLPAGKTKLLQAWIEIHRDELMADWTLAARGEPVFPIEPLR